MNTSTIKSHFLPHPEDLGIVTVGFSGGQVRFYTIVLQGIQAQMLTYCGIAKSWC
jgi:hypothetical protein